MSSLTRLKLAPGPDRAMFIAALGIMAAVSPMATDIYLASIPAAAEFFQTPITAVQLSLSTYMIGMALGQLVLGPVSDRVGRYWLLVAGTSLFALSSAGIALSGSIEMMLALRAVQGIAGAAGVVVGRAMVSDTVSGVEAAKVYTLLGTITSLAPIIAPLLGGVIASWAPWQTVFWLLTGFGLLMLAGVLAVLRETLPPAERTRTSLVRILEGPWSMLGQPVFMGWALALAFAFGALFAYISASSFVLQGIVGLSELGFSIVFAAGALCGLLGGLVNVRLLDLASPGSILRAALAALTAVNLIGLIALLAGAPAWTLIVHVVLSQSCFGFVMGNAIALGQAEARHRAGAGSAVIGLLQFLVGGLASPLSGLGGDGTAVPMAVCMVVFSALALAAAAIALRLSRRAPSA